MPERLPKKFDWYEDRSPACVAVSEFLATMTLVVVVGLAVTITKGATAPLAVAGIILALCTITGDFSGTHLNPCISLPLWLIEQRFAFSRALLYIAAQFTGAFVGAQFAGWLANDLNNPYSLQSHQLDGFSFLQIFLVETFFTAILTLVVLKAGFTHPTGNEWCPFYVVAVVLCASYVGGPISGACINPAVGMAFTVTVGVPRDLMTNCVAPFVGGIIGAVTLMIFDPEIYFRRLGLEADVFNAKKKLNDPETCEIENARTLGPPGFGMMLPSRNSPKYTPSN